MSFILEALKKSENKRRATNGKDVRTIHEPSPPSRQRKRNWIVWGVILLALNAGLLVWISAPWQKPSPPARSAVPHEQIANRVERQASRPVRPEPVTSPRPREVRQPQPAVTAEAAEATREEAVARKPDSLPVPRNESHVYRFSELPADVQRRIPGLQMSLHAYNRDNASASLVQLNNRIMREGDVLEDGLRLEQIVADGVIMRFDGYRFLLTRKGE